MSSFYLALILITSSLSERLPKPEKIVNGLDCHTIDFPYVVSIRVGDPSIDQPTGHLCGGSLVDGFNVLTAAHCYQKGWQYNVVAGQTHLQQLSEDIQIQPVVHVFLHPAYDSNRSVSDLAIFRLKGRIRQTPYTRYVQLPRSGVRMPCERLRTAGWGRLIDDDITKMVPFNLRCVQLKVISTRLCHLYYRTLQADMTLCTMERWSDKGVCFGDSGGPLMCDGVQYGIVSWGVRCFGPVPQVHTNVSVYAGFIMHTLVSHAAQLRALPVALCGLLVCLLVS